VRILAYGLGLLFILSLPIVAAADYEVGFTHGTNKHRPEFSFDPVDTYSIAAAKNEWEPFQVLIRDDSGVTNVNLTVSEFTGPGDPITEIEPYRIHYLPVYADEISQAPPDISRAGYWPDALVPFVDHFVGEDRDGAPFDVPVDFTQGVFVDLYVPENQAPGDYTATVTVTANGRPNWTGTIALTVWDFVLPNGISISSNYSYSRESLCDYYTQHGTTTDCEVLHERFFEEYARHRMAPHRWGGQHPPYTWDAGTQTLTYDWTDWDVLHAPYMDGTFYKPGFEFTTFNLEKSYSNEPSGLTRDEWTALHWSEWADHFKQKGWIEKLWLYISDEPDPNDYSSIVNRANLLHQADPELQSFITEQYTEGLGDAIDIWCPDEPLFSDTLPFPPYPEKYEELRAEGKTTWWYNCVSATLGFDYSNHMVDQESSYMRIWLWLTRRYEFTGILFWRIQYLWSRQDVWEDIYADKFLCQGDGTLYYPGTPEKIGGTVDIPLPSLRIKILREAMEDYEYMHILDQTGEKEWVDDVTRTVAPKTNQWEHDWNKLLDWRRKVAEKILGTLDETPPDPPAALNATADVESVALTWTAPSDADLAGFDVWYAAYSGDEFFGGSVDASTTSAAVNGLNPGQMYSFWVTAFDENGNRSDPSDSAEVEPLGEEGDDGNRNAVTVDGLDRDSGDGDSGGEKQAFGCGGW
jgi:Glycoside hydrolase 123, catalytic domain/Fibronectin type III domain